MCVITTHANVHHLVPHEDLVRFEFNLQLLCVLNHAYAVLAIMVHVPIGVMHISEVQLVCHGDAVRVNVHVERMLVLEDGVRALVVHVVSSNSRRTA